MSTYRIQQLIMLSLFHSDSSGMLQHRGIPIEELFHNDYEDIFYLTVWGHLPTPEEKENLRRSFAEACQNVPPSVVSVIQAFPCVSSSPLLPPPPRIDTTSPGAQQPQS